ncbi:MAG: hypothetical protein IJ666_00455 [Ruminococcus sp.]|nr:hypothetical protein [Ruminococcus sp.]
MKSLADSIKAVFVVALVVLLAVLSGMRLMKIQVVGEDAMQSRYDPQAITFEREIRATRGEILDYRGNVIVANDKGCDLVLQKAFFPDDNNQGNVILLDIYNALAEKGYKFRESIPITVNYPYEFTQEDTSETVSNLSLNVYATAQNCIDKLISDYEISDNFTESEKRIIAGMRYEMLVKEFSYSNDLVLASNVDPETVMEMKELSNLYKGIEAVDTAERHIIRGDILPHEIGTVGPIYAEEYDSLKEKGYALNDVVGKSGIESAMEKQLRGENGKEDVTLLNDAVVDVKTTKETVPGQTIKLTVDGAYQLKLQEILNKFLENFNYGGNARAGAVVVLDARTGAVKGMANAPTYNLKDYISDYEKIQELPNSPMFNRCTYGQYLPGSTFKTVTATAGLNEGIVKGDTTFICSQFYDFYGYIFQCTGFHGAISVRHALEVSCNCYFYELSSKLGIDTINYYANLYGFGQSTGIETGDAEGFLCSPEYFARLGEPWYIGYVIQAGIGNQSSGITPLQLAVAAETIANRGVRYKPFLVDSLYTYGSNKLISNTMPTIAETIELKQPDVYEYIINGMIDASHNLPYEYSLDNLGYTVAIKTGTPQTDINDKSKQNSLFIGFAPADKPEVAFAGVIEGGEFSKYMIRDILTSYQECYGLNGVKPKNQTLPAETFLDGTQTTATVTTTGTGTTSTSASTSTTAF